MSFVGVVTGQRNCNLSFSCRFTHAAAFTSLRHELITLQRTLWKLIFFAKFSEFFRKNFSFRSKAIVILENIAFSTSLLRNKLRVKFFHCAELLVNIRVPGTRFYYTTTSSRYISLWQTSQFDLSRWWHKAVTNEIAIRFLWIVSRLGLRLLK